MGKNVDPKSSYRSHVPLNPQVAGRLGPLVPGLRAELLGRGAGRALQWPGVVEDLDSSI